MTDTPTIVPLDDLAADPDSLPSPAGVAVEVLRIIEDPDAGMADLERTISADPALTARILKTVNSGMFGVSKEVSSIQRASMLLGLRSIRLMALSFTLTDAMPRHGTRNAFSYPRFWGRSIVGAVLARRLALRVAPELADDAYIAGLLGHLGRTVLAERTADAYSMVCSEDCPWPSALEETATLGYSSDELSARLLDGWSLPPGIGRALALRDLPRGAIGDDRLAQILHCALAGESLLDPEGEGEGLEEYEASGHELLSVDAEALHQLMEDAEQEIHDMARLLEVDMSGFSTEDLLIRARTRLVDISLLSLHEESARAQDLEAENRRLETEARTDALTGLANRGAFDEILERLIDERTRADVPRRLGLLMLDIDHFKRVNDTYGHQAGDAVLRRLGDLLQSFGRAEDLAVRYGGEEFAVVLPQITTTEAYLVAERLRTEIGEMVADTPAGPLRITVSVGVATLADARLGRQRLISLADGALYRSKNEGRNRTTVDEG
ncbi:MAG: GGDEF domain-containing protein [Actinomycetia bacterium]|nr:GGDEF domain-containing protein [Actinomycetes bacterium]